jgi:hypothetical protein
VFPAQKVSARTQRCAVIRLRGGRDYEGRVHIDNGFIHFSGVRRVRAWDDVTYRQTNDRSWPRRQVSEIRWLEEPLVAIDMSDFP